MWGRHNMFSSSIPSYHSSSPCSRLFIFMCSFTQSIHLFLGQPLLRCPSTYIPTRYWCGVYNKEFMYLIDGCRLIVIYTHGASTKEQINILTELPLGHPDGGHQTSDCHAGGSLDIIVESAVFIAVLLE
jgi:hypothetical protein